MAGLMLTAGRSKLPPIAIVTRLALQGCERVKTKLDREVDRLCAIDGGVHGYENVKLPKENFGPDGEVFPQYRADVSQGGGLGPDYKWTSTKQILVEGDPKLLRREQTITRIRDGNTLGRRVVYIRGGGDFYGPWAPSEHTCNHALPNLTQEVFLKEELK